MPFESYEIQVQVITIKLRMEDTTLPFKIDPGGSMLAVPVIAIANLVDRHSFSGRSYHSKNDNLVFCATLKGLSSGAKEKAVLGFTNRSGRTVQPFIISSTLWKTT